MAFNLSDIVRPSVKRLRAYQAEEIPCRVKLDANESPYGLPGGLRNRLAQAARDLDLQRYPDPEARRLRGIFARSYRVPMEGILLGNGSDELISSLITAVGGPVLYPVPTFAMYGIIARAQGLRVLEVPLAKGFDLDLGAMKRTIRQKNPKIIFLSSPNNPTGNAFSDDRLAEIVTASRGIVVIDEAYQPFSRKRAWMGRLRQYPNLVVLRTLSKIGLAGLRLGIMAASPAVAAEVNKIRLPFNINAFSQTAAETILEAKRNVLRETTRRIVTERGRLLRGLAKIPGVEVSPSDANFIFFRVADPARVFRELLARGVLIRNLDGAVPGGMRVTVGTPRENNIFLKALGGVQR